MTDTLARFLTDQAADTAHLEHATRCLVAEWSDDPPSEAMVDELAAAGLDRHQIEDTLATLTRDPDALQAGALSVLTYAWNQPEVHASTRGSIVEAKSKLPVVETAVIANAVMYGLWLVATKGRRSQTNIVHRLPDGGYVEVESTQWWDAAGPLRAITDIFASGTSGEATPGGQAPPQLPGPPA